MILFKETSELIATVIGQEKASTLQAQINKIHFSMFKFGCYVWPTPGSFYVFLSLKLKETKIFLVKVH